MAINHLFTSMNQDNGHHELYARGNQFCNSTNGGFMRIFSILLNCLFIASIWQLNGWYFLIALFLFLARDFFSFYQGLTNDN